MHMGATLLAMSPIVIATLLLAFRVPSLIAASLALALTVILTITSFPMNAEALQLTLPTLGPTTISVVVIILAGVILAEMLNLSGTQATISKWLTSAVNDRPRAVLLVGLGVAPFAESIIGWGLGVIICVPLLLGIGCTPRTSALISLLGIVLGPWGSLAPGIMVMSELGGTDFVSQGVWTALFSLPSLLVMTLFIIVLSSETKKVDYRFTTFACLIVIVMWVVLITANYLLSPPLAGVCAALAAVGMLLMESRIVHGKPVAIGRDVLRALIPYQILCSGLFATGLIAQAVPRHWFIDVMSNPATWLVFTIILSPLLIQTLRDAVQRSLKNGMRRGGPVALTTTLFLMLGGLLSVNGMSSQLAEAASSIAPFFLALTPVIGFVGGFITGSNSASAAMFAPSFSQASTAIGVAPAQVLGALNVAASAAVMASPPRVALAVTLAHSHTQGTNSRGSSELRLAMGSVMRTVLLANLILAAVLAASLYAVGTA